MANEHVHFVTGRLAEPSLRRVLAELAPQAGFDYTVDVLPITVAALMTPGWIARHLADHPRATRIVIPGYCHGDLSPLDGAARVTVERGPRDLRQLPAFFGQAPATLDDEPHSIEIIAEINHAPRLPLADIVAEAGRLAGQGADVIDVGCDPGHTWSGVAECVRALVAEGHRVSIDSWNVAEIAAAAEAGAELVLSVNASNRTAAADWGCEVVVIPDDIHSLGGLEETIRWLDRHGVAFRLDPILEPIGCGFAASLGRYLEVRRRYPEAGMMMGIGNLTELTDADSAAINTLLLGFCQELEIQSVLTTQVIGWAQSSVRECALARRLVHFAVRNQTPPKHLEPDLVLLRDVEVHAYDDTQLEELAAAIRDRNYRIFAQRGRLHLISADVHLESEDPFALFDALLATNPRHLDASHAFYLGFELSKALTALTLGKQYEQDEALDWGYLTRAEKHHRIRRNERPQE